MNLARIQDTQYNQYTKNVIPYTSDKEIDNGIKEI